MDSKNAVLFPQKKYHEKKTRNGREIVVIHSFDPFSGPARLFLYDSVVLDTSMLANARTGRDFHYLFRCTPNQTFDIQYRSDSTYSIAV